MALTPEEITSLLAETRDRGGYERSIRQFVTSGDLSLDVMDSPSFKTKKVDSLYNSFNQNVKKLGESQNGDWPTIRVLKKENTVMLVNMTAYDAAIAAANSENGDENDEVTE